MNFQIDFNQANANKAIQGDISDTSMVEQICKSGSVFSPKIRPSCVVGHAPSVQCHELWIVFGHRF